MDGLMEKKGQILGVQSSRGRGSWRPQVPGRDERTPGAGTGASHDLAAASHRVLSFYF